uniref:Dihydrolipoamide acetyltransferase component of pyruvate dehydrogenase complex n=1 Tax=Globodera rostochiensis TaxID=31243 RepID=A0A914GWG9_GLORO
MFLFHALLPKLFIKNKYQQLFLFHSSKLLYKLVQFNLSDIGEGIADVQVKEWHVKEGDFVAEFDELCSVQSDKATVTITSRYNGTIRKLHYKSDDIAKVGHPLVDIEVPDHSAEEETAKVLPIAQQFVAPSSTALSPSQKILASPAVRRLIREHSINTAELAGSGRGGRILKEDILKLARPLDDAKSSDIFSHAKMSELGIAESSFASDDHFAEQKVPIRGYTRAMVRAMTETLRIPHFGYSDEIVVDRLLEVKSLLATLAAQKGVPKVSLTPLIVKASSLALREFPRLNASLDASFEHLILKRSHNISLAIDTPDGLAVPNIKNCQEKSIWEIASALGELRLRAREGRLCPEDLAGGTFALSNIGSIGGTYMSPLIMPPQLVIGAIGSVRKVPCFDERDNLTVRRVINFSWSADHRVVDGATMARFSNRVKLFLEQPEAMLAELR